VGTRGRVRCAETAENGEAGAYVINAQVALLVGDSSQRLLR